MLIWHDSFGFSCELRLALIADCASLMAGEYQGASDEVYRKLVEEPRAIGLLTGRRVRNTCHWTPNGTSRKVTRAIGLPVVQSLINQHKTYKPLYYQKAPILHASRIGGNILA